VSTNPKIDWTDVEAIEPGPFQYRRTITQEELNDLAQSIEQHGVLQPVLLRPIPGKKYKGVAYQLVAGERRWRAAKLAGLLKIPAIIRQLGDLEAAEIALIENVQRENPDDWATALGIQTLMRVSAEAGQALSERAVAQKLGKSSSFIRNHLGLFKLHPELQNLAQRHSNIKSSLFELQKVKDTEEFEPLIQAVDAGASFQTIKTQVERIVADESWKREADRAPDTQTQQRTTAQTYGGGQMSRGRMVTGPSAGEAKAEIERALSEAERHLLSAISWSEHVSATVRKKEVVGKVESLKSLLTRLEA
jgi:ParB family chromosome partitioning protein